MSKERFTTTGDELIDKIKQLLREGQVTRVVVKSGDDILVNLPVAGVLVGGLLAPVLAGLSIAIVLFKSYTVEIERKDPS